jgi:hypothetical protein
MQVHHTVDLREAQLGRLACLRRVDALREAGGQGRLHRCAEAALGELRLAQRLLEDQGCWLQRRPHSRRLLEVSFLCSPIIQTYPDFVFL